VENLGLEELGVGLTERGFLEIDGTLQTNIHSISAIGDLAGPPLLAHKASEEGVAAVEFISGVKRPEIDYKRIPGCIYSQPQVAWIGLTEKEAQLAFGEGCRVGKFPFVASGKAVASVHTAGFSKIIAEPRYGQIVGAHIVGHGATELIAEIGLAMTLEATTEEISGTVHAHPTMSESIMEASLAAEGRSINF
jgi:dihydrolipoamide dehydrogenase